MIQLDHVPPPGPSRMRALVSSSRVRTSTRMRSWSSLRSCFSAVSRYSRSSARSWRSSADAALRQRTLDSVLFLLALQRRVKTRVLAHGLVELALHCERLALADVARSIGRAVELVLLKRKLVHRRALPLKLERNHERLPLAALGTRASLRPRRPRSRP